jgi:hypothetical protein
LPTLGRKREKRTDLVLVWIVEKAVSIDMWFFQHTCLQTRVISSGHCPSMSNSWKSHPIHGWEEWGGGWKEFRGLPSCWGLDKCSPKVSIWNKGLVPRVGLLGSDGTFRKWDLVGDPSWKGYWGPSSFFVFFHFLSDEVSWFAPSCSLTMMHYSL